LLGREDRQIVSPLRHPESLPGPTAVALSNSAVEVAKLPFTEGEPKFTFGLPRWRIQKLNEIAILGGLKD
jgi:hypothetical protein